MSSRPSEINGVLWTRISQLFFSSFENYKPLKKKVAGPIPDVERYFLKEANDLSLR